MSSKGGVTLKVAGIFPLRVKTPQPLRASSGIPTAPGTPRPSTTDFPPLREAIRGDRLAKARTLMAGGGEE